MSDALGNPTFGQGQDEGSHPSGVRWIAILLVGLALLGAAWGINYFVTTHPSPAKPAATTPASPEPPAK